MFASGEVTPEELLLDLARKSVSDPDFLPVLGDAVIEHEWDDPRLDTTGWRVEPLDTSLDPRKSWKPDNSRTWTRKERGPVVSRHARRRNGRWR